MRIISKNFLSACALGIISCFVLFLAASAPHRVHHLFENLPKPHGQDHHPTRQLSLMQRTTLKLTTTLRRIRPTPCMPMPHTTTKITTVPRKRSACFKAPHSIHIYPRRNR